MPPETASIVPNSRPPATRTNTPTRVRSRIASIVSLNSFRVNSQVVHLFVLGGIRNAVEKLAHARVLAALDFLDRPHGLDVAVVDQNDPVGDQERTGQFVG